MKTSWLRQLALLALHSTHSTVLATGLQTARNVLQSPTARSTQYAKATVLDTRPERTSAPSRLRIQPRQDTISTTEKPAVIVTEGYTIAAFPPYLCGFIDGDRDLPFSCPSAATCAEVSSSLCCATAGLCPVGAGTTACQNVEVTNYNDVNYGASSFLISSKLHCNIYQGAQCHTDAIGSLVQTVCRSTTVLPSQTVYPPQQFLNYFAGFTIEWDENWDLVAIQGGPSTSGTANSAGDTSLTSTRAVQTDAIGYLNELKDGAPACAINMTSLCPNLYASIQTCYNTTTDGYCYCNALVKNNCTGLCLEGKEPNDYLNYIVPICEDLFENSSNDSLQAYGGSTAANWTSSWLDYRNLSDTAYIQLFPWAWDVQLNATELANGTANRTVNDAFQVLEQCPSVQSALLSFAIVNLVVFVASIVTANRKVTHHMTCKCCGGPKGGTCWPLMAILSVAFNLAANVVNAFLTKATPGYHHVPLVPLILLWCTRPRLAWFVIILVWITKKRNWDQTLYLDSAVAALMAEVILQITGAVYMGISVNHARVYGFYRADRVKYTPHGTDALIMYYGALLWTASVGIAIVGAIIIYTPVGGIVRSAVIAVAQFVEKWSVLAAVYLWAGIRGLLILLVMLGYWCINYPIKLYNWQSQWPRRKERPKPRKANFLAWFKPSIPEKYQASALANTNEQGAEEVPAQEDSETRPKIAEYIAEMRLRPNLFGQLNLLFFFLLLPFVGQWIFWVGFVRMAQDLYCPPEIWSLTAVWSGFSLIALWCGAAN